MQFQDTKLFLCNKGLLHWGLNSRVVNAEIYDFLIGVVVFGKSALNNVLIDLQSNNPMAITPNIPRMVKYGFAFYDTVNQMVIFGIYTFPFLFLLLFLLNIESIKSSLDFV